MELLIVLNQGPYRDGQVVDSAWNSLRLAETSLAKGYRVNLFLMGKGVEVARRGLEAPPGQPDLAALFQRVVSRGGDVKLCKTCIDWHGLKGEEIASSARVAGMVDLVDWIAEADKVLTF